MKLIELDQNSDNWLDWRRTINSASEAPAIMGESKYFPHTPYELYLVHTGQKEVFYNKGMQDGHKFEDEAREAANALFEANFQPVCAVSSEFEYLGASLDGYDPAQAALNVLEIKTTTFDSDLWRNGLDIYHWQLVHQCIVAGTGSAILFIFCKETKEYKFDIFELKKKDVKKLVNAWDTYNKCMSNFEAPKLMDRDWRENESEAWQTLAAKRAQLKQQIEIKQAALKDIEQGLIDLTEGNPTKGAGLSVSQTTRKGAIDYKKVLSDHEIECDLDGYRKQSTTFWSIR